MFGYSNAGRLSLSLGAWSGTGSNYTEPATFKAENNQLSLLIADGGPLTSDPNYASGTSFTYSYDARQRLSGLAKNGTDIASYDYDYTGHRVSASQLTGTPTTVQYVFAPDGHLLAEHDGATGNLIREYIWLDDMPLALVSGSVSSPSYYYVHTGQIDEPLIVTDASKAKVWDAALDPWGQATMLATPTKDLNLRLPGQWYSAESGLHQNWMRDYDPVPGRYIEADPLGINAGANLYPYTGSNPLNRTDPTGQIVPLAIAGVCAGGGCEVIGLTILAALGWTATHPFTLPPTASTIPQAASDCPPDDDHDPCEIQRQKDDDECNQWNIAWQGTGYGRVEGYRICLGTAITRESECRTRGMNPARITTDLFLPTRRRGIPDRKFSSKGRRK